jgi:BirA family biotin operon repressor/biotin-[acetyl-CoA-carboxylase] ligase
MNIIKLNAIDSTNSYLKKQLVKNDLESFTVVTANYQTAGRGQLGTTWFSDDSKNLIFSILIKFDTLKVKHQFYLSMAVSLGIISTLQRTLENKIYVKWPNDILAEKDKVAGVLIENIVSGNFIKKAIVGIGLNVNQQEFPNFMESATSLKNLTGVDYEKDELLKHLVKSIKNFVNLVENKEFETLKKSYMDVLYKLNTPAMFEDKTGAIFLAKIIDVNEDGNLVVALENEATRTFNLKEIKFANQ